jgi:transcription elongation factor Elf1
MSEMSLMIVICAVSITSMMPAVSLRASGNYSMMSMSALMTCVDVRSDFVFSGLFCRFCSFVPFNLI